MTEGDLAERLNADTPFRLAARHWTGSIRLDCPPAPFEVVLRDGTVEVVRPPLQDGTGSGPGSVTLSAPAEVWADLLAPDPPPGCSDLGSARGRGLRFGGHAETAWQHYGALARLVELLRPAPAVGDAVPVVDRHRDGRWDSPTGRYLRVELGGDEHRLYVETAGTGVPLLLQHTAGAHGSQWRHLFEDRWLTQHFQLVAYDLPFHGKSLPPTGRRWWAEDYRLTRDALMQVPLAVADRLGLERPAFCGCSIGGLLALDLARWHGDRFRAVVAVEPALFLEGSTADLDQLWHPRISSEYKATLMEGLMSPRSPEALRKETAFVYAQGWPPAFLGDLFFYLDDHDLRTEAALIDTSRVGVHLLSGAYDWSATPEHGRAAHEAIAGSTFTVMEGVGHFPMSEHPEAFLSYLRPVLEQVLATA